MNLRFGSVCSGIEAASVAWHPLGWEAAWLSEIEPFPCALLAHHYPGTPNLGDMRTIARRILTWEIEAPDVFTGGTPCQAFSVAGNRESLADARGNLTLTFVEICNAIDHVRAAAGNDPCIIVWENVPGVLSTKDNAFGCFLAALVGESEPLVPAGGKWTDAGCVYGPKRAVAWRVLDAQYFGLAQRRRRVFVVASARNGFDPAAVLFEREGVRRDSAPRREAGEGVAGGAAHGAGVGSRDWPADVASTLNAAFGDKLGLEDQHALSGAPLFVPVAGALRATDGGSDVDHGQAGHLIPATAHTLRASGFDASEDGTGRGTPLVPVAFSCKDHGADAGEIAPTLRAMGHGASNANAGGQVAIAFGGQMSMPQVDVELSQTLQAKNPQAVAFAQNTRDEVREMPYVGALAAEPGMKQTSYIRQAPAVRRLTPTECERLQGFPDQYTRIPWRGRDADECPDGPRYKALGNSWAVPCAAWIGRRIADALA